MTTHTHSPAAAAGSLLPRYNIIHPASSTGRGRREASKQAVDSVLSGTETRSDVSLISARQQFPIGICPQENYNST